MPLLQFICDRSNSISIANHRGRPLENWRMNKFSRWNMSSQKIGRRSYQRACFSPFGQPVCGVHAVKKWIIRLADIIAWYRGTSEMVMPMPYWVCGLPNSHFSTFEFYVAAVNTTPLSFLQSTNIYPPLSTRMQPVLPHRLRFSTQRGHFLFLATFNAFHWSACRGTYH